MATSQHPASGVEPSDLSPLPGSIPLRALIVEDEVPDLRLLLKTLEKEGYDVTYRQVETPDDMFEALTEPWDIVLADYHLPHFSGLAALEIVQTRVPDLPLIIVSGSIREDVAVAAMKVGASDYVLKSNLSRLAPAVERGLREARERRIRRQAEEALRRSEEQYRELVENANDVVFTIDLQGNFTSINRAGEALSGYTRDEITQLNMAQVLAPESLGVAFQMIRLKLADDRPTTYELLIVAKDGHRVPVEVSTRLIKHDSQPAGVQGIARDISERTLAAEALRESEERFRGIFDNASDLVYTHDFRGNITSANRAVERFTGYSQEEAIRLNIADVVAHEHLGLARRMISRKLEDFTATTYELDLRRKDGQNLTVEINSQLIYEHGRPVGVQGIARDVTERRRAEEELRARERKQAAVAELGQRALASTDLAHLFDDAANTVTATFDIELCSITKILPDGETLQPLAGTGWKEGLIGQSTIGAGHASMAGYTLLSSEPVIAPDLLSETRFAIPDVLRDHGALSAASVIIHGRDTPFGVLNAFSCRQREFSQDDLHFLQAVSNVLATAIERRRLEEAREHQARELAVLIIQAQEEERKRIARELHDETAQSLSTLLINLDLLEPHIPPGSEELQTGFKRVGDVARRTLDATRALSHDLRPTILDDVGLAAALRWYANEYERTYGGVVNVHTDPIPGDRLLPEIEVALFRIAQEALTNCGKHASATQVEVRLEFANGFALLMVQDDGNGFNPASVPGPTRHGRLGLYGMAERASLLDGTLNIDASPGKGTTVRATIPVRLPLEIGV